MDRRHAWVIGLLCVGGCSTAVKDAPPVPEPTPSEGLRAVPEIASMLQASSPFTLGASGFAVKPMFPDGVSAQLEAGRLRLSAGSEPGAFVTIEGFGDNWNLERGQLHRKSVDVETWILAGANRLEDVRVLASAQAAHTFEYRIAFGPAYSKVSVEEGSVVVTGAPGMPGLVASRAWARDAHGVRRWLDVDVVPHEGGATVRYALAKEGLAYPVIVDPTWSTSSALIVKRTAHGQALMGDGRVLVVGGRDGTTTFSSAEILEPGKATISTVAMSSFRNRPLTITMADGNVLVAGGMTTDSFSSSVSTAEVFDYATKTWSTVGPMITARSHGGIFLLPSGKIVVAGGTKATDGTAMSLAEIYDPVAKSWTALSPLTTARHSFAFGAVGSKLVVAGGGSGCSGGACTWFSSAELLDGTSPLSATWSSATNMSTARYGAVGLPVAGKFLVVGGEGTPGAISWLKSTELLTLAPSPGWASAGDMSSSRSLAVLAPLKDGQVLVASGWTDPAPTSSADLFGGTGWATTANLGQARGDAKGTTLNDGRVLVAGGTMGGNVGLSQVEIYALSKPTGTACSAVGECATGFCVDGFCCDTACTGSCTACSAAKKGSGANGTCGSIGAGTADPRCTTAAASTCGQDGTCNGAGGCATYAAGTVCRAASCSGSTLTNEAKCAGGGVACPGATTVTCAGGCSGGACLDAGPPETGADTGDIGVETGDIGVDTSDASDAGEAGDIGDVGDASDAGDTSDSSPDIGADTPAIETGTTPTTDSSSPPADTGSTETPPADSPGLCDCSTPGAGSTGNGRLAVLGLVGLLAFQRRKR